MVRNPRGLTFPRRNSKDQETAEIYLLTKMIRFDIFKFLLYSKMNKKDQR